MTGAGLQCHVSDDGRVEVAIAGQSLQLSESQLARSPVLNSIADKPGVGIIPFSEEAFQHWYAHVEPVSRKSAADAKALLQVHPSAFSSSTEAYIRIVNRTMEPLGCIKWALTLHQ